jgi:hypothetical protein
VSKIARFPCPCYTGYICVEAPIRTIFVANKLMAKEWVKHLRILHVEPIRPDEYQGLNADELIRPKRLNPVEHRLITKESSF